MFKIKQHLKKFLYRFKKSKIKAVYEHDLVDMLKSLGIFDKIEKGESICHYCEKAVSIDNIEAIFSKDGEIKFICSNPECISKI